MKIIILPTVFLILYATLVNAQAPDTMWTKTYTYSGTSYDFGLSVQQTTDGGYIIGGETDSSGVDSSEIWLIKIDADGDTIWTRTYGGVDDDYCRSVKQTTDGGYIIAGSTQSFIVANLAAYIMKVDINGDTLWTKVLDGPNVDLLESVEQTTDSGYIFVGSTSSYGAGSRDVWLIKMDTNGDTLWTKTYGGVALDRGGSVQQTIDGGYIVIGSTSSFGEPLGDFWLLKTDTYGDTIWTKTFGGTASDFGSSVQQTSDCGYIATGFTESFGAGYRDVWLIKTDSIGDTIWTKTYGGVDLDRAISVQQTTDGGYIVGGYTESFGPGDVAMYLIRTDTAGDTLWTTTYGGDISDMGWMVQQTSDDGYIFVGYTNSFGSGESDIYLIKVAPDTFGIKETFITPVTKNYAGATIFMGSLIFPGGKTYRVFDITGSVVIPEKIKPGVYFIEVDGHITGKVVKVR